MITPSEHLMPKLMVSRAHHPRAYQALWHDLAATKDVFERRLQLDRWLKLHNHSLIDGERWETECLMEQDLDKTSAQIHHSTHPSVGVNWYREYLAVVKQALNQGIFYSDAFQKQLYHTYIETERLSLETQQEIHLQALLEYQSIAQANRVRTNVLARWLSRLLWSMPWLSGLLK